MNPDVRVDDLPGIGRRYELTCDDGGVLTVVIHHTGRRDLYVFPAGREDASTVSLSDTQARTAGDILSGTYFTPTAVRRVQEVIDDLVTDWVMLTPGSPGTECSIGDLGIRGRTGMSVMAILRGDTVIHEPGATEVLRSGDRLVVTGRRANLPAFQRLVVGRS
jgi:TrkA domain protein